MSEPLTADQISSLSQQHTQYMGVLKRRADQIRRLKELWARGNLGNMHTVLQMPQDHAVFCDFARAIMQSRLEATLNLDAAQPLLAVSRELITSKYDEFALASIRFAEVLLTHFSDLISDTRQSCANIPERQLDLAREERLRKCDACYEHFREIARLLTESRLAGQVGAFRQALHSFLQRC